MKPMEKAYNPKNVEDRIYSQWEESGFLNPDNLPQAGEPYAIMFPPPNVTGVLHLGHALENTIMDTMIRYQRMRGKKTLLLPGTDHSAVATQARVEDNLKKDGIDNPRQHYGREGLLQVIRDFAEQSKSTILSQIKKMGTSADWSRLAYTFDEDRSRAVNELFIRMYNDGLIYRGVRVVNWSVVGQSTASDDEVEHEERTTTLYTFKYAADFPIPIATTLPETKLGDTAVAVHPDDERYKQYIGQQYMVDVGAAQPLTIHVIADTEVDPTFGTGALGVTPAHSMVDFEMYQRNPHIGMLKVVGEDGRMTDAAGRYAGLSTDEARTRFVQWLRDNNLMINEEEITHSLSVSDRFKDPIWPIPMEQWFLSINEKIPGRGKSLKALMQEAMEQIDIQPERFATVARDWVDNYHDWCISRQIWWGHRIPVWYRGDEVLASVEQPEGDGWEQDPDTLDTWFSSAAWTFSTLGWPDETQDLNTFHPTAWMQMGHEIIRLWLVRMVLMSTYALGEIPFRQVYIHGILRDKNGRKFSKSLGNGIDPLDVIEQYGTDALRLSLVKGIAPGNDARFYEEKVEDARNFVNKLWNVARFVQMQESERGGNMPSGEHSLADRWILSRLNRLVQELTDHYERAEFSPIAEKLYDFLWHEYADWYVEMSKIREGGSNQQLNTLHTFLRLLQPVAPFVSEAVAQRTGAVNKRELLMMAEWPTANTALLNHQLECVMEQLFGIVTQVRNIKSLIGEASRRDLGMDLLSMRSQELDNGTVETVSGASVADMTQIFQHLAGCTPSAGALKYPIAVSNGVFDVRIDLETEEKMKKLEEQLQVDMERLEKHVTQLGKKLKNKQYLENAPKEVVQETRLKQSAAQQELEVKRTSLLSIKKS